jgi:hypothetical protein
MPEMLRILIKLKRVLNAECRLSDLLRRLAIPKDDASLHSVPSLKTVGEPGSH